MFILRKVLHCCKTIILTLIEIRVVLSFFSKLEKNFMSLGFANLPQWRRII